MSIRLKIILIFLSFILVSVGYYQFSWVPQVTRTAEEAVAAATHRHIKSVADGLVPFLLQNQLAGVHETLENLHRYNPDWLEITLHDTAGRRLFPLDEVSALHAEKIRTFIQPIRAQEEPLGILSVTIDFAPAVDPQLKDYRSLALRLGGAFLVFLLCVGLALEIFVRRPTRQLATAANLLARGNFDAALPKPRRDEIGTLVASFSSMRDQIKADQFALRRAQSELEVRVIERTRELRETNDALMHSEAQFRDFAEAASDRFWECDKDYRFTLRWDSESSDLMLPRDQLIGKTYWALHDGKGVQQLKEIMERNAAFREHEIEIFPVDGRPRFRRISGKPFFDEDGVFAGYRGVAKDISEEVKLRVAADEMAQRLESITENSPTAISLKDLDGRYQVVNRQFTEWGGMTAADAIGKTAYDLFPKKMADANVALDRKVQESGRAYSSEREVEFVGGRARLVYTTKFPVLDGNGALAGIGTINVDMTAARNMEEQLRQAQKMEAVGQLTGGVAHDFNNLLTIVLGNLELLYTGLEDAENRDLAERSMKAARRGAALTQQLLAYSRRQTLAPRMIDAAGHVAGMIDMLRRTLGATIEIDLRAEGEGWRCEADPAQLENVILNLAINARDAMPNGGELTIVSGTTRLTSPGAVGRYVVPAGDYVVISVSDTGSGMPAETIEHVFEPFFTTKEVGKGSGLGLSMVYGFIKQSGGHVTIESELDVGTTFKLYLPKGKVVEDVSGQEPSANPGTLKGGKSANILLVEDDPDVRRLAVQMLRHLGHHVTEASTGQEALAVFEAESEPGFDLLLSDVVLAGGMSGVEVARAIQDRAPDIRIVYMSGYTNHELDRLGAGPEDMNFLPKPFQLDELSTALDTVFAQHPAAAEA